MEVQKQYFSDTMYCIYTPIWVDLLINQTVYPAWDIKESSLTLWYVGLSLFRSVQSFNIASDTGSISLFNNRKLLICFFISIYFIQCVEEVFSLVYYLFHIFFSVLGGWSMDVVYILSGMIVNYQLLLFYLKM